MVLAKTMKVFFALMLAMGISVTAFAQTQKKCFTNAGLRDEDLVYLTINGTQVTGEYITVRGYQSADRDTWRFSGSMSGNNFLVTFAAGEKPGALPPNLAKYLWTLVATPDKELLRINIYGKNYNTGKHELYAADFESCRSGYTALLKSSQRVTFAKGASSASVTIALKDQNGRQSFRINLGKGQAASVPAVGCGISFYYPDKTLYEEGTAIDRWSSIALTQGGDYLFVLSPAGMTRTCYVTFSAI